MKTKVDGVTIELTKEQVEYINKVKAERAKEFKTFDKVLKTFGFKEKHQRDSRVSTSWVSYVNEKEDLYAEVHYDMTGYKYVWIPGSPTFSTPLELGEHLARLIDE